MMAAATTTKMNTVPILKIRPRKRSRISRTATSPTSFVIDVIHGRDEWGFV
jgi:hypothetical protein